MVDPKPPSPSGRSTCSCSCPCCGSSPSSAAATPSSPLKRKLGEMQNAPDTGIARVEIENEAVALREALASHQTSVQELSIELEEERNAASTAATEAMSMILRLQREKAETQMEASQFKRFAEEKMAHDQQEIVALEDLLYKRDQAIQALNFEVQAYRHRLMSFGIGLNGDSGPSEPQTPASSTGGSTPTAAMLNSNQFDIPTYDYPQLRCRVPVDDDPIDLDKYPFEETPREHLQNIEQRICKLERMPSSSRHSNVMDKGVVGQSPRKSRHFRTFSMDNYGSGLDRVEEFPAVVALASEPDWGDEMDDRVCTVDMVHRATENYVSTPREASNKKGLVGNEDEHDVKKLYTRLQALEADRESMRQTIMSMSTDKAQMLLMREIAQQLCNKEKSPDKKIMKKSATTGKRLSLLGLIKEIME